MTVAERALQSGQPVAMHRARDGGLFTIRPCESLVEVEQCVSLQQQTWGNPDIEVVPRNMFVLAQAVGGHLLTAWTDNGHLAGYAVGLAAHEPAGKHQAAIPPGNWMRPVGASSLPDLHSETAAPPPRPYLHSHQVAVVTRFQGSGLGFALKLAQRRVALACGLTTMRWTFDPTMAMNAYFNLHRLGAVSRLYVPNFYGVLGSRLQGGLPTDRLLAEWSLTGDRVRRAIERRPETCTDAIERIAFPSALAAAKAAGDLVLAESLQSTLRHALQTAFEGGLELCGFVPEGAGGTYLLRASVYPQTGDVEPHSIPRVYPDPDLQED